MRSRRSSEGNQVMERKEGQKEGKKERREDRNKEAVPPSV